MARARDQFRRAMMLAQQPAGRIEVALGLAPVLNILDCLDEEEQLLAETVPLAQRLQADAALARLFQLQGNLYFPRGDYARSRQHHEQALHYARLSQDVEMVARATSGIGDSYYSEGGMARAYELFDRCVSLGEQNGLLGVEASNRGARASAAIYLGRPVEALHDADNAVRRSRQVGDRRAEIFSRLTASWVLVAGAVHGRAGEELGCAIELARETGAARFEAFLLEGMARVALHEGRQAEAERYIGQAAALVESQRLHTYVGPWVYGTMALVTDDDTVRQQCLQRGQAQLERGALAHNRLRFHLVAAELHLLAGDIGQADVCARQLRAGGGVEPCAWATMHGELIAAAADWLQHPGAGTRPRLQAAMTGATTMGYAMTMPRLMQRIAGAS
jgi:tetratricopeptide (TPR) repeat protein